MKQLSYPPFIVFFDSLAIFLFLLILNQQSKPSEVIIPQEDIFAGGRLIYKMNGKYYDENNSLYQPDKHYYLMGCTIQKSCKDLMVKLDNIERVYILLPKQLHEEMSYYTFLALNAKICSSIKFFVTEKGVLDYQKMAKNNNCLLKIPEFREKINKNISS